MRRPTKEALLSHAAEGLPYRDAAAIYNVQERSVQRWVNKYSIQDDYQSLRRKALSSHDVQILPCEQCNSEHSGKYGSGRFCSEKCARSFATNKITPES